MPPHSPSSSPRGRHAKNDTLVSLDNLDYLGWRREIVVLVDPYSTGCLVGKEIMNRGYLVVCVWTYQFADVMKQHVPKACGTMHYYAVVEQGTESLAETAAAVQAAANDLKITACIAGGDRGVDLADALSEFWGMPMTNGTDIPNRRDKKIQQELVRATGLRAVRQAGGAEFDGTVEAFLRTESYPLVVKPIESSGSDGVKLCTSYEQAKDHFFDIMSKPMVDGGANTGVLCQEVSATVRTVCRIYAQSGFSLSHTHCPLSLWILVSFLVSPRKRVHYRPRLFQRRTQDDDGLGLRQTSR